MVVKTYYSVGKTMWKGVKSLLFFGIPFVAVTIFQAYPDLANLSVLEAIKVIMPDQWETLTVGGVLVMLGNFIMHYVKPKLEGTLK